MALSELSVILDGQRDTEGEIVCRDLSRLITIIGAVFFFMTKINEFTESAINADFINIMLTLITYF